MSALLGLGGALGNPLGEVPVVFGPVQSAWWKVDIEHPCQGLGRMPVRRR